MRALGLIALLVPAVAQAQTADGTQMAELVGARGIEELDLEALLTMPTSTAALGAEISRAVAPASLVVMDRETIARHGWTTLADILANVPGLYVFDDLVQPSLGVRGVTGGLRAGTRIVRVMTNGVEVNFRPDLSAFIGREFIPIEAVERVEIAKGPLSALYGANAFLATVNVITRAAPADGLKAEVSGRGDRMGGYGWGRSAMVNYGSQNWQILTAFSDDTKDRSGLRIQRTFATQDPTQATFAPFFSNRQTQNDVSTPVSAYAMAKYNSDRVGTLAVQSGTQRLNSAAELQLNSVFTGRSRVALNNDWASARWDRKVGRQSSLWLSGNWGNGAPDRDDRQEVTDNPYNYYKRNFGYTAVGGSGGLTTTLRENLRFTIGTDFLDDRESILFYTRVVNDPQGLPVAVGSTTDVNMTPADPRKVTLWNAGGHTELAYSAFTRLHFFANLRLDKPSEFDTQYSWRGAAAYEWSSALATKLIAGRAFQAPSAVMLYAHSGFGYVNNVAGSKGTNPLIPQTVNSVEFVTSGALKHVLGEVSVYWQRVSNAIGFPRVSNNFVAGNMGTFESVGLELSSHAEYRWLSADLSAVYQWTLARTALSAGGQPQSSCPTWWGRASVNAALERVRMNLNANLRLVGPRGASQGNIVLDNNKPYTLPSYVQTDIALRTLKLFLISKEAETRVSLVVRNLFDDHHPEPGFDGADFPVPGRDVMLELRQLF